MGDFELLKQLSFLQKQSRNIAQERQENLSNLYQKENRIQKDKIPIHWLLVLKSGIAGMSYYVNKDPDYGAKVLGELVPGTELILQREYNNEHDRWAIAIFSPKGEMLGYMTRYKNETIARLMDYGKIFHAVIDKPVEFANDNPIIHKIKTPTENFALPYSVYMEELGYGQEEDQNGGQND